MLVSSDRDGGQIVTSGDETRFYDDIGCLASGWRVQHENATAFVRVADGAWVDAAAAWFAHPAGARTAMGSGLKAFATEREARSADAGGHALTWDDVVGAAGGTR